MGGWVGGGGGARPTSIVNFNCVSPVIIFALVLTLRVKLQHCAPQSNGGQTGKLFDIFTT